MLVLLEDRSPDCLFFVGRECRAFARKLIALDGGEDAGRLLSALGEETREIAELGSRGGGQTTERLPPLFPKIEAPA